MPVLLLVCLSWLARAAAPAPASLGMKIAVRYSSVGGGATHETTEYVKTDRKRFEYRNEGGPRIALITRCDEGRLYELNLDEQRYHWSPLPTYPTLEELKEVAKRAPTPAATPSPTEVIETTTVDTGERRMMFGHEARHVRTTRKQTPLGLEGRASDDSDNVIVTDGWYIDLDDMHLACDPFWQSSKYSRHAYVTLENVTGRWHLSSPSAPPVVPVFKDVGKPETGRPLLLTITSHSTTALPDGTQHDHVFTSETRVTELTEGPLDPALFDVPAGFHHDWTVSLQAEMNATWLRLKTAVARWFD